MKYCQYKVQALVRLCKQMHIKYNYVADSRVTNRQTHADGKTTVSSHCACTPSLNNGQALHISIVCRPIGAGRGYAGEAQMLQHRKMTVHVHVCLVTGLHTYS